MSMALLPLAQKLAPVICATRCPRYRSPNATRRWSCGSPGLPESMQYGGSPCWSWHSSGITQLNAGTCPELKSAPSRPIGTWRDQLAGFREVVKFWMPSCLERPRAVLVSAQLRQNARSRVAAGARHPDPLFGAVVSMHHSRETGMERGRLRRRPRSRSRHGPRACLLVPVPRSHRVGRLQGLCLAGQLVGVRAAVPAEVEGPVGIHVVQGPAAE